MTNQEEPQRGQPNAEPPTQTPSERPPTEQTQGQSQPAQPIEQATPQPPPLQPPTPMQPAPPPYPFPPVTKLPWIAPARKGTVIAIGIAAAVVMFGAGIGAGAAIFHNDQPSRPTYQFRLPNDGQRHFPGFPQQLPTPSPTPSQTS
jgi:hypothetical protein